MKNGEGKACLDHRVTQITHLIGGGALFQAGAMIKGGRRCAELHSCDHWEDCAGHHGALWDDLNLTLGKAK